MTQAERDRLQCELSAYLDGEAEAQEVQRLEALLRESAEARALLDELRSAARDLASLPRVAAPPGLTARISGAILESPARPRIRLAGWRPMRWLGTAAGVAAGLLVIFSGRLLFSPEPTGPQGSPDAGSVERGRAPLIARTPRSAEPELRDELRALGYRGSADNLPATDEPAAAATEEQQQLFAALGSTVRESVNGLRATGQPAIQSPGKRADAPAVETPTAFVQAPQIELRITPRTTEEYTALVQRLDGMHLARFKTDTSVVEPADGVAAGEQPLTGEFAGGVPAEWHDSPESTAAEVYAVRAYRFPADSHNGRDLLHWLGQQDAGNVQVSMQFGLEQIPAISDLVVGSAEYKPTAGAERSETQSESLPSAPLDARADQVIVSAVDEKQTIEQQRASRGGRESGAEPPSPDGGSHTRAGEAAEQATPDAGEADLEAKRPGSAGDQRRRSAGSASREAQRAGGGRGAGRGAEEATGQTATSQPGAPVSPVIGPAGEADKQVAETPANRQDEASIPAPEAPADRARMGESAAFELGWPVDSQATGGMRLGMALRRLVPAESQPSRDGFLVAEALKVLDSLRQTVAEHLAVDVTSGGAGRRLSAPLVQFRVIVLPPAELPAPASAPR